MDVMNAFLNAKLNDTVYMEQPPGINNGNRNMVCKLHKAVYGIKQAPNEWNQELNSFLISKGFTPCKSDTCIYFHKCANNRVIIIGVFVDDIVFAYHQDNRDEWINFKNQIMNKYKVKDQGDVDWILGMKVTRDRTQQLLKLDQSLYVKKILSRFKMISAKPVTTPEQSGVKLLLSMSPSSDDEKDQMKDVPYRAAIGALTYAATGTRPDIAHAVNECSKFSSNPGPKHWIAVKRIMRYLVGTVDKGLCYSKRDNQNNETAVLDAYADADWAGDKDDRKSTSGYVIKLNGDSISWSSRKQRTIALSTAEAEYMAISDTAKEIKWLQSLLQELSIKTKSQILTDNQAGQAVR
jgi:hypothetical protein